MFEVYLFLAMLAVQVVLGSILIPRRLWQLVHQNMAHNPATPDNEATERRRLARYRVANIAIAVIGLVLMGSLFSYIQRADWDNGPIEVILTCYFFLQFMPGFVIGMIGTRINKMLRNSLAGVRRTAELQRRHLFDFVSPVAVILALLCYPVFVALVFHVARDPFKGFGGAWTNIGIVSLLYAGMGYAVYRILYGKKSNPLQTHAQHMEQIGKGVRILVYTCMAAALYVMTNITLAMLNQQQLEPFALSAYFTVLWLWVYQSMNAAPVEPTSTTAGESGASLRHP